MTVVKGVGVDRLVVVVNWLVVVNRGVVMVNRGVVNRGVVNRRGVKGHGVFFWSGRIKNRTAREGARKTPV